MACVRRATEDDWRDLRAVRLAALADAPSAFGSSLAAEAGREEDKWREWTRSAAVFLAFEDAAPVGMVAALPGEVPEERRLVALWVQPQHRRTGVASQLVAAIEGWAREVGASRVSLWVSQGNSAAERLYLGRGYVESGQRKPLPSHPVITQEQLRLELR